MFVADCLQVNQEGHLCVEQRDVFGAGGQIRHAFVCNERDPDSEKLPAVSRFPETVLRWKWPGFVCQQGFLLQRNLPRLPRDEEMGLGCRESGGELYTAVSAGFPSRTNLLPWQQQDSV